MGLFSQREEAAMREPDLEKLNALVGKLVGDLGISLGGASILLGDRLGLYKAMADGAVVTPPELAKKTGLHERYVREWLSGQAASGYIDYHPEKNAFSLSAEQAMAARIASANVADVITGALFKPAALASAASASRISGVPTGPRLRPDVSTGGYCKARADGNRRSTRYSERSSRLRLGASLMRLWLAQLRWVETPQLEVLQDYSSAQRWGK
jgi:hypothetical protein